MRKVKFVLKYGGVYDATKVVAPFVFRINESKVRMLYIGTSCKPEERNGYRILSAESKDGINFKKQLKPFISLNKKTKKHYAPALIKFKDKYFLYFSSFESGYYKLKYSKSNSYEKFNYVKNTKLELKGNYNVHTPRFIYNDQLVHCYFTASKSIKKIFSKKYPKYDFGQGFKIWHGVSDDGINFKKCVPIKIKSAKFLNIYGHSAIYIKDSVYLFFTGFDGSINKIYLSTSSDFINFSKPREIIGPNIKDNELGVYSSSVFHLKENIYMLYYGVRYFTNYWNIKSLKIDL